MKRLFKALIIIFSLSYSVFCFSQVIRNGIQPVSYRSPGCQLNCGNLPMLPNYVPFYYSPNGLTTESYYSVVDLFGYLNRSCFNSNIMCSLTLISATPISNGINYVIRTAYPNGSYYDHLLPLYINPYH